MSKISLIMLALIVIFQYNIIFGKNGILDFLCNYKKILIYRKNNNELKEYNDFLISQIEDLKDKDTIEELSRKELNMIKSGEQFYNLSME